MALAHLLAEDREPPADIWEEELVSSRLVEYEVWTRVHARDLGRSHADALRLTLARLSWVEMQPEVLRRATLPFPMPVRTLDALHLASMTFLREHGYEVALATYDGRLARVAETMDIRLAAV